MRLRTCDTVGAVKLLAALTLCVACGGGETRDTPQVGTRSVDRPAPGEPAIRGVESLIDLPLVAVKEAFGDLRFSIAVPRGFTADKLHNPNAKRWQAYDAGNPFVVMVEHMDPPPTTFEAYEASLGLPRANLVVVRKQTLGDGSFSLITRRASSSGINVFLSRKDHRLSCQAAYARGDADAALPNFDATLAYLDKICASLSLE
jgi:hypothetical protein